MPMIMLLTMLGDIWSMCSLVMMILTVPRKGIQIVPGVSQDSRNENRCMSQPVLSGCQFTDPKCHEIHIRWVHTEQKYLPNIIITTILQKQQNIDIESLPKSEVFWGNISNYGCWHSKAVHINSALINAFLEVWNWRNLGYTIQPYEWNRCNCIWCGFEDLELFFMIFHGISWYQMWVFMTDTRNYPNAFPGVSQDHHD